jgi:CRISPR-associated protein Csm1
MAVENTVFSIAVSSLLHDIGKFAQRAGREEFYSAKDEGWVLPHSQDGRISHHHALYTLGFLENHLADSFEFKNDLRKIAIDAAQHHNSENEIQHCISLGDRLASGLDRSIAQTESDKKFYEMPIISVFSQIQIKGRKKINSIYLPLSSLDGSILDVTKLNITQLSKKEYSELWDQFLKDWQDFPKHQNKEQYLYNLDAVLERWTSYIPSATYKTEPDVSLYDHSRVTAALAVCAYKYHLYNSSLNKEAILDNVTDNKFLFVFGDVQGIQKYIFNIEDTKNSSKLLRARSYQIEALCRSAAVTILSECGLIPQCELMNGGGNFLLVLPNTPEMKQKLKQYEQDINAYLMREYLGVLSLALSWEVEACATDLAQNKTKELLDRIQTANYETKQRKFHSTLEMMDSPVINYYYDKVIGSEVCDLCGYRPVEAAPGKSPEKTSEKKACSHCSELIEKASQLTSSKWMILKTFNPSSDSKTYADFCFYPSNEPTQNNICFAVNSYRGIDGSFNAMYPQPYSIPRDCNGAPLTFEEIAEKAQGTHKLAMFKADVDNLGKIFKDGLGEGRSISKIASLSRQMHYFFSVRLNEFIKKKYEGAIYTVFSGGDDICVIGPWDKIFDFASDIHAEFNRFVHSNPSVTISAGIALANSSTPVPYIAAEAESQLEESKNQKRNPNKNAITVFNVSVSWDDFDRLLKKGKEFSQDIQEGKIPTSLMRKLLDFSNRAEAFHKGVLSPQNALWLSHLKYTIKRMQERIRSTLPPGYWDNLMKFLLEDEYAMMRKSKISICYALYRNRDR